MMQIPTLPLTVTDWAGIPGAIHLGETGQATQRRFLIGDAHVRLVEYSAGHITDHWCDLKQVPYVHKGELDSKLRRGPIFKLRSGMSYRRPITAMRHIAP